MMKQAMGWNFCSDALGTEIMSGVVDLVQAGKVKPVIGEVVGFDALPSAITRMRDRQTTGRVIVTID